MLCQIDPTPVILEASKISPEGGSSAYGWLVVVLALLLAAALYGNIVQYRRTNKVQDSQMSLIEKNIEGTQRQVQAVETLENKVESLDKNIMMVTTLINAFITKNNA